MNIKLKSFTMAEILLSLTIIGVVAAITLPSLTGNINERTWNTQRKALYARMSQAIALMGSLNGYGQYAGTWEADSVTVTVDTAAKTFVTDGLSKVLKLNNICDEVHLQDCGINSALKTMAGSNINFPKKLSEWNYMFTSTAYFSFNTGTVASYLNHEQKHIDTKVAAFETKNGESVLILYNPFCRSITTDGINNISVQPYMCANFIYDLNGKKGPNTVGKDIGFITALYPTDSNVVAPMPSNINVSGTKNWQNAIRFCNSQNQEYRLPNRDEMTSIFYNFRLVGNLGNYHYWTNTVFDEERAWSQSFERLGGMRYPYEKSITLNVRCVER